ncbi:MAG: hypothetical protein PHQ96_01280, partial [Candidatus Omnitrophica bacterium]|nr:hypothetical protein [Candidatus Omnitrophota bacterium]
SVGWSKYLEWAKIRHLKEVVSLDCALCPSVLKKLNDDDWSYLSEEKTFFGLFADLEHLKKIISYNENIQVLAVCKNPKKEEVISFSDRQFEFKGFDLVEDGTRISALTNCGGFPKAFSNEDLSESGLIVEYEKAKEIQKLLLKNYPEEHHANCSMWAIWKLIER